MNSKKMFSAFLAVCVVTMMMIVTGCKTTKPVVSNDGEVELKVSCSGPEFFTSKGVIRASAFGERQDQMLAKKKAQANTREQLAATLNVTIKSVVDNYYSSRAIDNVEQAKTRFEGLTRQVVDQQLSGVATICEKFAKTKAGTFKCYLAQELSGEEIVKGISAKISQDDKLRLDFEYEKFKNEFNKEMDKGAK